MKLKKKKIATLTKVWAMIRALAVITLWWNPILGFVINIALDAVDGNVFYELGAKRDWYQHFDKRLDFWFYIWLLIYSYVNYGTEKIWGWFLGFWLLRFVGEALFEINRNEKLMFYFPNMFTWLFVARVLIPDFLKGGMFYLVISMIVVVCLIKEWWIHVMNFSVGQMILGWFGLKMKHPKGS